MVDFGWADAGTGLDDRGEPHHLPDGGRVGSAADADNALKAVPAWASAPRHAVDEYASATVREWESITQRGPLHKMWQLRASVAREWAAYREKRAPASSPKTRLTPQPESGRSQELPSENSDIKPK